MSGNRSLASARQAKQDEFYTQLGDISNEVRHYRTHFKNKVVLCNCDDPYESNFFKYFALNFNKLSLKTLIATNYQGSPLTGSQLPGTEMAGIDTPRKVPYVVEISEVKDLNSDGAIDEDDIKELIQTKPNVSKILVGDDKYGGGDFRSKECIDALQRADIVVTNPPFSLFREFLAQLIEHKKNFLIIGSKNAISYKDVFQHIIAEKVWLGSGFSSGNAYFKIPSDQTKDFATGVFDPETGLVKFRNVGWFTNMDHAKRHEELTLFRSFSQAKYPKYDNFDAINVDRVAEIPSDYYGVMGVPITYLDYHNPKQFKIIGITKTWFGSATRTYPRQTQVNKNGKQSQVTKLNDGPVIKLDQPPTGQTYYVVADEYYVQLYARLLIQRVQDDEN